MGTSPSKPLGKGSGRAGVPARKKAPATTMRFQPGQPERRGSGSGRDARRPSSKANRSEEMALLRRKSAKPERVQGSSSGRESRPNSGRTKQNAKGNPATSRSGSWTRPKSTRQHELMKPQSIKIGSREIPKRTHKPDATYLDYTVVPLLLRSGMAYDVANEFAQLLHESYTAEEVEDMMSDTEKLLEILSDERIEMPRSFRKRLETDRFWVDANRAQGVGTKDEKNKRKSYVYFRAEERARASQKEVELKRNSLPAKKEKRKSQFVGGRAQVKMTEEDMALSDLELERLAQIAKERQNSQSMKGMIQSFKK